MPERDDRRPVEVRLAAGERAELARAAAARGLGTDAFARRIVENWLAAGRWGWPPEGD